MNAILALIFILFILMALVGGKRGVKAFFTLFVNLIVFFIVLKLISVQANPLLMTLLGSMAISAFTLFYITGVNKKTVASLISVTLVVLLTLFISYKIGMDAKIGGFGVEQLEVLQNLNTDVPLNFTQIFIAAIVLSLLGAVIDVSISISSSMNELYENNPGIPKRKLFASGIAIGKDILGTMTNTLLFAYIAGFMSLIIYFELVHYSLSEILNKKTFVSEIFLVFSSGIGIILIIPVTAYITSYLLKKANKRQA